MEIFIRSAIAIFVFQSLLFLLALIKKNNGIADIGWGIGFIIISLIAAHFYFFKCTFQSIFGRECQIDIAFVFLITHVTLWAIRLSIYLLIRNWSKPEDWRYAKWRQDWGKTVYIRSYLQVFILQGFFMLLIGSPIILSGLQSSTDTLAYTPVQYTLIFSGLIVWLIGFFFQAVGDYQLFVFKKDPANKGRVMRYGLWKYTRHPNYFGEATMWWGIFLISCVSAYGVLGILLRMIGPATITFMLLRVSGVTMLENKYKGNKDYEDYQRNTSSFVPMYPRKK